MHKTMAVHLCYNSWYISILYCPPQNNRRKITKLPVLFLKNVHEPQAKANFSNLYFKFIALSQFPFGEGLYSDKQSKWI